MENKEQKMTREEAIKKFFDIMYPKSTNTIRDMEWAAKAIAAYEALGLMKFEEEKDYIVKLCSATYNQYNVKVEFHETKDNEGLVLWVGGQIVWKSWEKYYKKCGDFILW